jgi:outer membrane protein assembly factor BamA
MERGTGNEDLPEVVEPSPSDAVTVFVREVRLEGNEKTRAETLLELLPRATPSTYRRREIAELERRINNLGIFDSVAVRVEEEVLVVTVREKFTLTPSLDFSTGQRARDFEGEIGLTEYNFLGHASELGVVVGYEQRGPTAWVWFSEHSLRPNRWAFAIASGVERASFRFGDNPDDPTTAWSRDRAAVEMAWRTPYVYAALPVRYEVGAVFARELVALQRGEAAPPDGWEAATMMGLTFDRYTWRDLVPNGLRIRSTTNPGWYFPERKARLFWNVTILGAIPLARYTVIAARAEYEGVSFGNPNHNVLIGSQDGVRGLRDAFYRDRQHSHLNVELRQAIKLAERWAIQGVLFSDLGVFEPMDARGKPTSARHAVSLGAGVRLIPTFLTQLLLRLDLARLLAPEERWFFQLGVTQYF